MNNTLPDYPGSWFFYIFYIVINGFIFLNMIVGVVIDVMIRKNSSGQSDEIKSLLGLHNKLDNFEKKFIVNSQYIDQTTFDKFDSEINSNDDTKITVGIIIEHEEKILLLQRPNGTWAIPKGHVKEGESNYEGMVRELKEETNLNLKISKKESWWGDLSKFALESKRNELINLILTEFLNIFDNSYDNWLDDWKKSCMHINKEIEIFDGEHLKKKAIFKDIDAQGNAIIETKEGEEVIATGQISIKGVY